MNKYTVYYNRFGYHVWNGDTREIVRQFGNDKTESAGIVPLNSPHCAPLCDIKLWAEQCAKEYDTVARYDPTGVEDSALFDELIDAANMETHNRVNEGGK